MWWQLKYRPETGSVLQVITLRLDSPERGAPKAVQLQRQHFPFIVHDLQHAARSDHHMSEAVQMLYIFQTDRY